MDEVIDWMGFYNHRRLHSTLTEEMLVATPIDFDFDGDLDLRSKSQVWLNNADATSKSTS